jgi:hypothetical protein
VSRRVWVQASAEDAALAAFEGSFSWGQVTLTEPPEADLVVALGDAELPAAVDGRRCVRLVRGPAPGTNGRARVAAQAGAGAWRLAPWPASDALFELEPPGAGHALVVDPSEERRDFFVQLIAERGLSAGGASRLALEDLREASVVLFPTRRGEPLPAEAPAVLASRRLLVTGTPEASFGLLSEVDWFHADYHDDLAQYADTMLRHPQAFRTPRALGARAAERWRASALYARMLVDVELEEGGA